MDNKQIVDFTRRLSQCNSGELIVIMYDIFFAHVEDAKNGYMTNNRDLWKSGIRKAQRTLDELMGSLDFSYDIAMTLHPLYRFNKDELANALVENKLERVESVEGRMKKLYIGFCEAAKTDDSKPLMSNTQQVYAGMTYGKYNLNESYVESSQRGFFA